MAAPGTPPLLLLTEDDVITGFSLREVLTDAGFRVPGPPWSKGDAPAPVLRGARAPFPVPSSAVQAATRVSLRGASRLSKPVSSRDVVATLDDPSLLVPDRLRHPQTSGTALLAHP
ncbi:hypothetical protein OCOJLMKI_2922 [Methylobacterium iners]|uniref:Response regulatory domain-containing protein n=1 Tax=Methylobacterium iners TaxID=418707 RepID=A0ABQ4RXY6_9HYPH|nr:hypothetical protein OCOJLMKI_2922 [Methylobacterium iners]